MAAAQSDAGCRGSSPALDRQGQAPMRSKTLAFDVLKGLHIHHSSSQRTYRSGGHSASARRHTTFQLFMPVEHNVDVCGSRELFALFEHQEMATVRADVVIT
jgi:hypothetical protein